VRCIQCGAPPEAFHATDCPIWLRGAVVQAEPDPVNHPAHYNWLPFEVIEVTEHFGFLLGNVLKYVMRADHKGKPLEDLKKAQWYLNREITRREAITSITAE
jgi:hypothetical protein